MRPKRLACCLTTLPISSDKKLSGFLISFNSSASFLTVAIFAAFDHKKLSIFQVGLEKAALWLITMCSKDSNAILAQNHQVDRNVKKNVNIPLLYQQKWFNSEWMALYFSDFERIAERL